MRSRACWRGWRQAASEPRRSRLVAKHRGRAGPCASSAAPAAHNSGVMLLRPPPVLLACGALGAALLTLIVLGHDGKRVLQLAGLALPLLALMVWPLRSPRLHRLRSVAVWLGAMVFALDGVVRAYLLDTYGAAPDSTLVLSAVANTTAREGAEYLSMHWRAAVAWAVALAVAAVFCARQARRGARGGPHPWPRSTVALLCVALLAGSLAHAGTSWRRLHPVAFWSQWGRSVADLRAGWADRQAEREALHARARAAAPTLARSGASTVVLVITDSVNRDNMSLYGYGRPTTPRLAAQKSQLGDALVVLKNAWSVDASTLPAMRSIFGFGDTGDHDDHGTRDDGTQRPADQHLIALARAAGYKVWWMSNHDDIAIEQQHARMADVVEMMNRTPGRSSASLDGELLDCIQEAMHDPAERKLVIVHLMGAHPHYRLRFPADANPFDDAPDAVETDLLRQGRAAWVRQYRHDYDAAVLYHDFVVAETLQITRHARPRAGEQRAWMFLSDHGQEVGHGSDHAGHSPRTASGYRIPALVWRSRWDLPPPPGAAAQPFRSDWAGWTLADLLDLHWPGLRAERDVLRAGYRWEPPRLPTAVASFTD